MAIDLHLHTTASDGSYTPFELVSMARKINLQAIAITDHDTVDGVLEVLDFETGGPEIIPGIELSTEVDDTDIHILGYFIDLKKPGLNDCLSTLQENRRQRCAMIIDALDSLGIYLSSEAKKYILQQKAPGRMLISRALCDEGHVKDSNQAFDLYLSRGRPAFVPRISISPYEAIDLIMKSGGISVLAHPRSSFTAEFIFRLKEHGLGGLEVIHSSHTPQETKLLLETAARLDLAPSGGSDCHGPGHGGQPLLGTVDVPSAWLSGLKDRWEKINKI